jgi:hypothetical protein
MRFSPEANVDGRRSEGQGSANPILERRRSGMSGVAHQPNIDR